GTETKNVSSQDQAATQKKLAMLDKIQAANQKGLDSAKAAGKTADIEKYENNLLDNIKRRNSLLSKNTEEINKQADATKKASTQGSRSNKKDLEEIKQKGIANIKANQAAEKPLPTYELLTGKAAQKNADLIDNASKKANSARNSQASVFENYAKRYQHAQGQVDAAIIKGTRALAITPRTSEYHRKLADSVGELRNLSRGLGSEKTQEAALKTFEQDSKRLFGTIDEGVQKSKKHMGFMNKWFAKLSIIMSGFAATMFVWQQLSAAIGAVVRNFTSLEKAMIKVQQTVGISTTSMMALEKAGREAGKTGATTADMYVEMATTLQEYGMTAEGAINSLNAAVERHTKIMENTLSLQIDRFFGLWKELGYITFGGNAKEWTQSLKDANDQLEKISEAKTHVQLEFSIVEGSYKVIRSIANTLIK
ncbi:MAG TPA: hypothetical protein VMW25_02165, partial [Clostridia bacterium]|nr:hypothetical protein [Clostridia bacterium]